MARWEKIGCFGLTEADNGSDAGGLRTVATKTDGGYVLNGNKRWIGNATICDVAVVWAREADTGSVEGFLIVRKSPTCCILSCPLLPETLYKYFILFSGICFPIRPVASTFLEAFLLPCLFVKSYLYLFFYPYIP